MHKYEIVVWEKSACEPHKSQIEKKYCSKIVQNFSNNERVYVVSGSCICNSGYVSYNNLTFFRYSSPDI